MKISLAANETKSVSIPGDYFYLIGAQGRISVKTLGISDSRNYDIQAGMGIRSGQNDRYKSFEVKEMSGFDQVIEFDIGDQEIFDNRSVGVVQVINSDKQRTELNQSFVCATILQADATKLCNACIRNPAGSGKNIYLNRILVSAPVDMEYIIFGSIDIASDEALASVSNLSTSAFNPHPKKIISPRAVPAAKFDTFHVTSSWGGTAKTMQRAYLKAGTAFYFQFTEPLMIAPNCAIAIASTAVNQTISGSFEFFEEVI